MSDQIEITRGENQGSLPVISLKGRLDAAGAEELRDMCLGILAEGCQNVVICLSGVSFVSSSGLGTFLLLTEKYRESGGKVVYVAPSDTVRQVVALLNLSQFLQIVNSVEEATAAVGV